MSALSLPLVVLAAFLGAAWCVAFGWFPLWAALARRSPTLARGSLLAASLPALAGLVLVAAALLPLDPHGGLSLGCHCAGSGWLHLCPLHPALAAPLAGPALVVVLLLGPGRARQLLGMAQVSPVPPGESDPVVLPLTRRVAFVAGVLRPRVVVDRELWDALSPDERAVVLAHERGHVRRRDPLVLALLRALCALGPPAIAEGVVRAWLRRAELAADQLAAAQTDPVRVAEVLLRCSRLQQGAALALSWGGGILEQRVTSLLEPGRRLAGDGRDLAAGDAAIVALAVAVALAAGAGLHHPVEHLLNLGP